VALALADNETTYWSVILLLGLIVILAVVALLSLLVYYVKLIDKRVASVRDTLDRVTHNTENAALIPQTADRVDAVLAEGLQHHLFLGRAALATAPSTASASASASASGESS
jgi:Na+-transporting methylmalonyl-CoA/oxaloacetate decarboxylase gamma subunit